jgi:hypothetical protein
VPRGRNDTPKIDFKIAAIIVARRSRTATARKGPQPSLPGLIRQSITFEDVFGSAMDTRGKPAYDIIIKSRSIHGRKCRDSSKSSVSDTGQRRVSDRSESPVSER